MILETVRIISDWLQDATYGVNAVRLSVPKDTGVTDFPAVTVLDSTRDGRVARGGVPNLNANEFPCLLVSPADQPTDQQAPASRPFPPDATVTVLVRVAMQNVDTARAERDASQIIKCLWWQIPQLMLTPAGAIARGDNVPRAGVQVYQIQSMQAATLYEAADDTLVTGGVLVTCRVRYLGPT